MNAFAIEQSQHLNTGAVRLHYQSNRHDTDEDNLNWTAIHDAVVQHARNEHISLLQWRLQSENALLSTSAFIRYEHKSDKLQKLVKTLGEDYAAGMTALKERLCYVEFSAGFTTGEGERFVRISYYANIDLKYSRLNRLATVCYTGARAEAVWVTAKETVEKATTGYAWWKPNLTSYRSAA